ncbi:MAG: hypothetical protein Q7R45_13315, partial [Sulfuricaulis sp.]|nr:hypothetical protein [Sulfuricaulis sp.]
AHLAALRSTISLGDTHASIIMLDEHGNRESQAPEISGVTVESVSLRRSHEMPHPFLSLSPCHATKYPRVIIQDSVVKFGHVNPAVQDNLCGIEHRAHAIRRNHRNNAALLPCVVQFAVRPASAIT